MPLGYAVVGSARETPVLRKTEGLRYARTGVRAVIRSGPLTQRRAGTGCTATLRRPVRAGSAAADTITVVWTDFGSAQVSCSSSTSSSGLDALGSLGSLN